MYSQGGPNKMMTGITNEQVSEVLREDVRSAKLGNLNVALERERLASGKTDGSNGGVHLEASISSARPGAAAAAAASASEEQEEVVSSSKRIKTADFSVASTPAQGQVNNFRTTAIPARSPLLHTLPPVPERPYSPTAAAAAAAAAMWRGRAPSPAASTASSSNFSAATTSASSSRASSSRASMSSSRSCTYGWRGSQDARGSSPRPYSQICGGGAGFFPPPPSWWSRGGVRGGGVGGDSWRRSMAGRRERSNGRERERESVSERRREWREKECRRRPRKDYAREAGVAHDGGSCSSGGGGGRGRSSGKKRSRSCSRERGSRATRTPCETKCSRCMEWCRVSHERKPISRTLPMDYWVRTKACKEAKSKHIDYIDNATYSREQFIEETVFTCPSTGAQRDIVLERNMFPYDVPTDVEHWTLWSREDLSDAGMQEFVQKWAVSNHPHAVEWECDNNEGDRSINWFHVHVFFRIGCEDRTGLPRDPASVYDSPCRKTPTEGGSEGGMTDGEESAATDCE